MSSIDEAKSASTSTFVTALVFNAIVFGGELAAFTILRPYFKAIYEPRTYVPAPSKRSKPLSESILLWPLAVYRSDYRDILRINGPDAYFFVRFLRLCAKMFLPIWLLSWVVLLPVTSVGTQVGNHSRLDRFIFGNVAKDKLERYAAHIILVYLFTFWVLYNIKREMRHFVITRQQYLIDPGHARSVQANTILVTGIPAKYLSKEALLKVFGELPGGIKRIWMNRNLKELPDVYDRRLKACNKLESAETSLMKTAAKIRLAALKKNAKGGSKSKATSEDIEASNPLDHIVVPKEQRPQHRLGLIPFTGEKVDTIEWAREEIRICNGLLEKGRNTIEDDGKGNKSDTRPEEEEEDGLNSQGGEELPGYPPFNSAFITFNNQISAHLAAQVLTHHEPYRMAEKYLEVSPGDVIWSNLNLNPYEQKIRMAISYAATAGLIILWAFPVAFVGIISNVYRLCETAPWLAWICRLPPIVIGIIAGILPPVLLAVLMMLLPIVLRLLARFEGIPKYSGLELALMSRFFTFQVVHSFLIVTLSSGIIAALPGLVKNPTSVPSLLAQNLPQASTFFLTYVILQGLSGTAAGFLQIVPLVIYYVKLFILGSTPRAVYDIKYTLRSVAWGTTFPGVTLLVVIALGYSIIAPVINGLAWVTFFLFYQLYKYLFLWQFGQPTTSETGGLFFPKALQHIFVGLYVEEICLAALFFLARDENNNAGALAEGILMVVLIVITAFFHAILNNSYTPLLHALPLSLADKTYSAPPSLHEGTSGKDREEDEDDDIKIVPATSGKEPESQERPPSIAPEDTSSEEDQYGFAHPAISRPQRTIWIPRDTLGIAEEEERSCREAVLDVSLKDATMDEKGKVDVSGAPPDAVRVK